MSFTINTHNSFNGSHVHPSTQSGPGQPAGVQYFMYPPVATPQPLHSYPATSAPFGHPQPPPSTAYMPFAPSYQPQANMFAYPAPPAAPAPPPSQTGASLFQQLQAQYSWTTSSNSSTSSSSSSAQSSQRIPPSLAYDCSYAIGTALQLKPVESLINMSLITYAKGLYLEDILLVNEVRKSHSIIYGRVQGVHQLFHIELSDVSKLEW